MLEHLAWLVTRRLTELSKHLCKLVWRAILLDDSALANVIVSRVENAEHVSLVQSGYSFHFPHVHLNDSGTLLAMTTQ